MFFKKTGEIKVFKKEVDGFTKKVAEDKDSVQYTVDDLVKDNDNGINPYDKEGDEDEDKEGDEDEDS